MMKRGGANQADYIALYCWTLLGFGDFFPVSTSR
jgi:hypothetical protein